VVARDAGKVVVSFPQAVPSAVRLLVPVVLVMNLLAWSLPVALRAVVPIVPSKAQGPA